MTFGAHFLNWWYARWSWNWRNQDRGAWHHAWGSCRTSHTRLWIWWILDILLSRASCPWREDLLLGFKSQKRTSLKQGCTLVKGRELSKLNRCTVFILLGSLLHRTPTPLLRMHIKFWTIDILLLLLLLMDKFIYVSKLLELIRKWNLYLLRFTMTP